MKEEKAILGGRPVRGPTRTAMRGPKGGRPVRATSGTKKTDASRCVRTKTIRLILCALRRGRCMQSAPTRDRESVFWCTVINQDDRGDNSYASKRKGCSRKLSLLHPSVTSDVLVGNRTICARPLEVAVSAKAPCATSGACPSCHQSR